MHIGGFDIIFGKVFRFFKFSDIMEQGAHAADKRISSHGFSGGLGQSCHGLSMEAGARGLKLKLFQQRVIDIAQEQERHIGNNVEYQFKNEDKD